ncbi:hypothetical protein [Paenibacillus kobensis]|uniref:hypothetical protein n=1 Tax=Paenibacillus kobensis TaxID=59841 RepID=UPI000FD92074|nr:hypothetical protein [Paenibacillus kobensis]
MNICLKFGDTSIIGLVNAQEYKSFVNSDWKLNELLNHFSEQMTNGNLLVYQMTNEGIEHSWNILIENGSDITDEEFYRKAEGYIKVTSNRLYIVDYDCLTMSAQFEDSGVPDKNCKKNEIDLSNGTYKVTFYQYYNVDESNYMGRTDMDAKMVFTLVSDFQDNTDQVFWCTYY